MVLIGGDSPLDATNFGDTMTQAMFRDFEEESHYYFIAKNISEEISIAIDEIDNIDGAEIIDIEVNFNGNDVETVITFIKSDKEYSWNINNTYKLKFVDSIPKVLFFWITTWKNAIQDNWGDCVGFYF